MSVEQPSLLARGDLELAYLLLRFVFGVNIAMHGIVRFLDLPGFVQAMAESFQGTPLPKVMVESFAWTIPFYEALIGLLLIFGLFTRAALIAGTLLMAALTFGICLQMDWNVAGLQLIYVIVYAILIAGLELNRYSLDYRR